MKRTIQLCVATALVGIVAQCVRNPTELGDTPDPMTIAGLAASYDQSAGVVNLSWQPAATPVDYYRVYRSTVSEMDTTGNPVGPDTSFLKSLGRQRYISGAITSFVDILDVANSTYWYGVKGVRGSGANETEGLMSNYDSVTVGVDVSFNIRFGQVFTVMDSVPLVVNDPADLLRSVKFTQVTSTDGLPDFAAADSRNPVRSHALDPANKGDLNRYTFPWWLQKGNGAKTVWAELTYRDGAASEIKVDDIKIEPFGNGNIIKLTVKNKIDPPNETMRYDYSNSRYVIYKPFVQFSVAIFADTTIDRDFYYWIAACNGRAQISPPMGDVTANTTRNWLETVPRRGRLTGMGPEHKDDTVYTYMLDPDSAEGIENVSALLRTWDKDGVVERREDTRELPHNANAYPGSYWGDPAGLVGYQELIKSNPGSEPESVLDNARRNYNLFRRLDATEVSVHGAKQFILFALFRGRYFGDVRVAATISAVRDTKRPKNEKTNYLDLYQPFANMQKRSEEYPDNFDTADVIAGSRIIYELNRGSAEDGGSVTDKGAADVDTIELIVARVPEYLDTADNKALTGRVSALRPEDILNDIRYRYSVFPFEVRSNRSSVGLVRWDIPTESWPTGKYMFGIRAVDEFGNGGFASVTTGYYNPWWATVLTGK